LLVFVALVAAGSVPAAQVWAQPQFPNPVYEVGTNPYSFVKADFDGDGIADLIASDFGSGSNPGGLAFLRGLGDAGFEEAVAISTLSNPGLLLTADVNGDGRPDLLYESNSEAYSDWIISLRLNLGGGAFAAEQILSNGGLYNPRVGDFNGDGLVDLLLDAWDGQGYLVVHFGNGDGTFVAAPRVAIGSSLDAKVADLNADGRDDVVMMSFPAQPGDPFPPQNDVLTLLSRGDGGFDAGPSIPLDEFGYGPPFLQDLDGDGSVDLALNTYLCDGVGTCYLGPFLTFFGHGDASFEPGPENLTWFSNDIESADVNGDGITDILTVDGSELIVLLGNGDRTYSPAAGTVSAGSNTGDIIVGDWDRDGLQDVALLSGTAGAVFAFAGNGDGTFGPQPVASLSYAQLEGVATGDFNGDGRLDIVAGRVALDDVAVVLGNGDGTFGAEVLYPAGISPLAVAVADFNRDGRQDLAVLDANWHDFFPDPIIEGTLSILFGNGDGTFGAPVQYPSGGAALALAVGDVNGDGAPDAVIANVHSSAGGPSDLSVFLNDGTGVLGSPTTLALDVADYFPYGWTSPAALAIGDVTGDGHVDIAVAIRGLLFREPTPIPSKLTVIPGNGDGTFQTGMTVVEGEDASSVTIGDLNDDGLQDLVFGDPGSYLTYRPGAVQVILAGPGGAFQPLERLEAGPGPLSLGIADFNADAIPDLTVSNNGGFLAVLPGVGNGTFGTRTNFGLFGTPVGAIQGDFNSDGLNDMMVVTEVGVFVLSNQSGQHLEVTATISNSSLLGKGSGVVSWTTSTERDIRGFNVVILDSRGRRQINSVLISCEQCTTGVGASYSTLIPKHKSGHNIYIEVVHRSGRIETFGPARKE
jgi:hypothetical protein